MANRTTLFALKGEIRKEVEANSSHYYGRKKMTKTNERTNKGIRAQEVQGLQEQSQAGWQELSREDTSILV